MVAPLYSTFSVESQTLLASDVKLSRDAQSPEDVMAFLVSARTVYRDCLIELQQSDQGWRVLARRERMALFLIIGACDTWHNNGHYDSKKR